jgi:pyruvate/2-oxoglutarate dehydrogenase complex dihydrolipoamide acyltransferase (E2) component
MATEVFIPKMTDFMEEGTILAWLVAEGDHVEEGQPILEIETDKANVEMEAPATGYLVGIRPGAVAGAVVPVGEPIAYLTDTPDEAVTALAPLA